jgi:acyl dehydratase
LVLTNRGKAVVTLDTLAELSALEGKAIGASPWMDVEQATINMFADATGDHQWIHVDTARAQRESPFGGPIAHGYLTLSLLAPMWGAILRVKSVKMAVNYGLNKVRFISPVPAGSRVRLQARLKSFDALPNGGAQIAVDCMVELEGHDRPAVAAEALFRMFE